MQSTCQFLSESEQERVHEESLKILQEVGALFHSDRALKILEKNGANVDKESKIAALIAGYETALATDLDGMEP